MCFLQVPRDTNNQGSLFTKVKNLDFSGLSQLLEASLQFAWGLNIFISLLAFQSLNSMNGEFIRFPIFKGLQFYLSSSNYIMKNNAQLCSCLFGCQYPKVRILPMNFHIVMNLGPVILHSLLNSPMTSSWLVPLSPPPEVLWLFSVR